MTLTSLMEHVNARADRELERPLGSVDAVYDDELWDILRSYGLLEQLDAGKLFCYMTGVPLTRQNLAGIVGTAQGPKPIADIYAVAPVDATPLQP